MDEQQRINVVGSSSNSCSKSHDVFLSFHGEDTRWNFTSHLYEALNKEKVKTYIDDQLKKGDEISPALIKAIEDSRVSIVIFSENYASSKWCLGELSKILECREKSGQLVIPVFYMVDPTDVRKQAGSYEQAFVKHEGDRRCKQWKADLTKAANLVGYHSKNYRTQPEFLKKIVEGLLGNLAPRHPIHLKGLVGIEESLAKIESLLKLGSSEVITIGIWGMGGIGKTTHATALRDKLSDEFEGHCFLTDIGESSHELITLREKLFCKLLGKKDSDFNPSDISRLRYKKVLIVLDNVTTSEQFEKLIKEYDFLGPGSRVIVTTRDKHILGPNDKIYEVQDLDFSHSLQLFCLTAFKEKVPKDGYEELSRRVISYCKGVPLALKVLGTNLFSRSIKAWESELSKLQSIPNMEIHNVLKLSYDGLDVTHKDIFLDIACFFKNEPRGFITSVLEAFDFFPEFGIEVLLDKALITISKYNQIEMHDLIREMGWRIVQEESKDIGRRSRLWKHEDVLDVLKHNKGTDVVEGIDLDLFKLTRDLNVSFNSLAKMTNLRFLRIHGVWMYECKYNVYLTNDLNESFNKLRYLYWDHFKLEYFPSNFCVEQLVVLRMRHSNLKKLWNGVHNLVNLKEIDLSFSKYLIEIPDLSTAQKLEKVCLSWCTSLHRLHPSILCHPKLTYLDLSYCEKIERLNIHSKSMRKLSLSHCSSLKEISAMVEEMMLLDLAGCKLIESCHLQSKSLTRLSLNGCSSLKEISVVSDEMKSLNLSGTAIRALSSSMLSCPKLKNFHLIDDKFIESLDLHSKSLTSLFLDGCSSLKEISVASEEMTSLNLSGTAIRAFSSSMLSCPKLENFYLTDNKFIESLDLHSKSLTRLFLNGCSSLKEISVVSEKMTSLNLSRSNIESFPANIKNLSMLKELCLRGCRELVSLPELPPSLRKLCLRDCRKLMSLPEELPPSLIVLELDYCKLMSLPEELPPNLDRLSAGNCISLKKGISQQVVLQHMLHSCVPCIHQQGSLNHYFAFPRDHVMDECGFHTAEGSITISCLPISHFSGFIYCIVLPKRFVSNDILMSIYQDHVEMKSWTIKGMQFYRSCDNAMSDHVIYCYGDLREYHEILLSGDITFTIEFVGSEEIKTEFRVFPVYPTASGFKLGICESESIDLEQLPTSKRRRTRP
ncbi:TMV resistance protein N [Cajanus cajan]|uniref:TMV resistance protein N n=1 Tax=Cajanus cajan TaxID=3821 RepID=UPI00098DAE58|nr:TMV resistance protein N [Cajanus cajan]XP_020224076.1 TMV resistance protein N [Cajanus cajan]XP_020224077.1 TMV resistance protein N [Cajanus cajan]XP_020224078.1 TMV resistance protein N [Cajanus cajan]